ncbi:MAG: RNA methyltransferase [Chitinophagia bacterium]|nr:RNA methyltransferase [Chitinophagia bacterium]
MLVKSVIKDIQSLALKKHREQSGLYLAEGPKLVEELLLHHRQQLVALYALPQWIDTHREQLQGVAVTAIDENDLTRVSQLQTPHQVLAVVRQPAQPSPIATNNFTVVCCGLQDPGNLGTIIRTADWFGVRQLVCSPDTVDCFNPKVVQATMGSILRVAVHYLDLASWIDQWPGVPVLAAQMKGVDIRTMDPVSEAILLIGNESVGIPGSLLAKASVMVSIPGKGQVESLNAAVATGILLSYLR